jgi:hypothetical protein
MTLDNPTADCQPHAATLIFLAAVQALEGFKNAIEVLHIKTDAIILNRQFAYIFRNTGRNLNHGRMVFLVEFQTIIDQVL